MSDGHLYNGTSPEGLFRQAMQKTGISTRSSIIADGKLHRFQVDGDRSRTTNGWYVLYNGAVPAGAFGNWKRGISEKWCSRALGNLPREQQLEVTRQIKRARRLQGEKQKEEWEKGCARARDIWEKAAAVDDHPYLIAKRVKSFDLRGYKGSLVVPLRDSDGGLHSLQFIDENCTKRFLKGGRTKGNFFLIGEPKGRIFVTEGYATAATIHEISGDAVAVAFTSGNLRSVAKELHRRHADLSLVIAADNDQWTTRNPGLTKAREAALAVGGDLAVPEFTDMGDEPTDFNDLLILEGAERVRETLNGAELVRPDLESVVQEMAELSPVEYDQRRKDSAKALRIRVTTLDDEVVKRRTQTNLPPTDSGSPILLKKVEPWPEGIDGAGLLDELTSLYSRYVVLPEFGAEAIALWTLHTYAHDAADYSPILAVISPEKRCGKTTLLRLLGLLVNKRIHAANTTGPALFRVVELRKPTLLIDEADTFLRDNKELRGILNSGHQKETAAILRTVGDDHEPRTFSTWAPKAIAIIGKLSATLMDRSISIALRRRRAGEPVQKLRYLDRCHTLELSRKCVRWALDAIPALESARPDIQEGINDRAADNWEPLLAIADRAGADWPQKARASLRALVPNDNEEETFSVTLLADIRNLFRVRKVDRISSAKLIRALGEMEERPWPEWRQGKAITARQIAKILDPFGIIPQSIRFDGGVLRGYRESDFLDAFTRYLPEESATPLQGPSKAGWSGSSDATPKKPVADGNDRGPVPEAACSGVAHKETGIWRKKL